MLYSYIIKYDAGSAPNPFWGICTLAICKPAIRRTANKGDWIIGTGSKNSKCNKHDSRDLSGLLVFAMKVTKKLSMKEYEQYCKTYIPNKIPDWRTKDWHDKVGDCIYTFNKGFEPSIRLSVHDETNRQKDLGGLNVLLSNQFYYFGKKPRLIPTNLLSIIKKSQGHLAINDKVTIQNFENWIGRFQKNKIYADPQRRWAFDKNMTKRNLANCQKAIDLNC